MPNFCHNIPFTKISKIVEKSKTFVSVITTGNAYTPIPVVRKCDCAINRVVWCLYIQKGGDDRSFWHYCRVSASTDGGKSYKEIYYDAIGGVNGAVSTGSFNPEGTVYTHVKIEIWNGTVYDCAGCAVVYRE